MVLTGALSELVPGPGTPLPPVARTRLNRVGLTRHLMRGLRVVLHGRAHIIVGSLFGLWLLGVLLLRVRVGYVAVFGGLTGHEALCLILP